MQKTAALCLTTVLVLSLPVAVEAQDWQDGVFSLMNATNDDLKAMWMDFRLESVEFYTLGQGRSAARIHQQAFRWVDGDPRRNADGANLTWTVDASWGEETASGVPAGAVEAAIRRATATWAADTCLDRVNVVERKHLAGDLTVTDFFVGDGTLGDPFAADVVHAGFHAGSEPMFRPGTLAFAATYIFVDRDTGVPTDRDGDGYLDVALTEIYYNDDFAWGIDADLPMIDVETVVLHELGHAFDLGHFGIPPEAVMNPVYDGQRHGLLPIDHAGLCAVWQGWQ
jgi:hypothetical protein